ncbi:MAG: glycosyltransferase [Candidatus Omnitrophica bacterium]|nr:glycosyltransferase [Candidatus Omnitrophota bacterium]
MGIPTLSVVMSNYNHAKYIAEALEAVLSQSFKPIEVIVIDDASTDNSIEIIGGIIRNSSVVKFVKNVKNVGGIYNVNKFLNLIKGDYFYSAAADDKILPGFFEKSMELLARYPQAGFCSTRTLCIDAEGRNKGVLYVPAILNKGGFISPEKTLALFYRHGTWMQGNTVIFRKRALIDSGGFIPELHSFCDGFMHQVIAAKYGACFIPQPLAAWRRLNDNYSIMITRDSKVYVQLVDRAKKMMLTTYRDLFSADYVNAWEKRELINFYLSHYYNLHNDVLKDLKKLNLVQGFMGRYLFGFRRLCAKIDYFILKFYLYHRAKLCAGQLIIQRIKFFCISIWKD